jgi:predicted HicB family RNase H-like nuclease
MKSGMVKKPESEVRSAPFHAKVRPRFKKWAEAMAREDDRSLAQWLETIIQAEHERREAKSQRTAARKPSS